MAEPLRLRRKSAALRKLAAPVLVCGLVLFALRQLFLAGRSEDSMEEDANGTRVILTWTPFFGGPMTHQHYIVENGCAHLNCRITTDRRELRKAHALVFHTMSDFSLLDAPPWRSPRQRYVMLAHESAENGHHIPSYNVPGLRGFFNWTMTMRRDSDVPYPYAVVARDPQAAEPDALLKAAKAFDAKKKPIVWFVSHCQTTSRREKLVALMKKHISVDVFGGCGRQSGCPRGPTGKGCEEDLLDNGYFFHLAFENSVCTDYVTEKYQGRFMRYSIPIVLSRAVANGTSPPNSVIAVDDFKDVRQLVKHLEALMGDRAAWTAHFGWKLEGWRDVGRLGERWLGFCGLCQRLWDDRLHGQVPSVYWDMDDYWFRRSGCSGHSLALAQIKAYHGLAHPDLPDSAVLDMVQEGDKY